MVRWWASFGLDETLLEERLSSAISSTSCWLLFIIGVVKNKSFHPWLSELSFVLGCIGCSLYHLTTTTTPRGTFFFSWPSSSSIIYCFRFQVYGCGHLLAMCKTWLINCNENFTVICNISYSFLFKMLLYFFLLSSSTYPSRLPIFHPCLVAQKEIEASYASLTFNSSSGIQSHIHPSCQTQATPPYHTQQWEERKERNIVILFRKMRTQR